MNAKDFDEIVGARLNWCMKTLCAKGDEYAREGDRLWNFKVAARKLNCHPAEALAGMMVKHTVSVDDIIDGLAKGIVPPKELVAEKIGDSIDYLLLLEGVIEEERRKRDGVPVRAQVATSAQAKDTARDAMATSAQRRVAMDALASACADWLHIFDMRCAQAADPEMRRIMVSLREQFRAEYPDILASACGYTVPPLQDGDDDPIVHVVPDRTARSGEVEASDSTKRKYAEPITWLPCPND